MAELAYEPTEWADFESGNTPITAAALNNMEGGIADAVAGVNTLDTKRLQTYRVAENGDTATQDVNGDAIIGPCLIFDESITGTYYEPSSGAGDRKLVTSADQIKALQDSVSRPKGTLPAGTDLNTVLAPGVYAVQGNTPHGASTGWACVLVFCPHENLSSNITQVWIDGVNFKARWQAGYPVAWSQWT